MSDTTSFASVPLARARVAAPVLPLRVRDLVLRYQEATILDGIALDLGTVGCTVIMGPNGAGKTLFLKLLHGLIQPTSGTIKWGDLAPPDAMPRQALVFQKPVLLRRSVAANIDFVLKSRSTSRQNRDDLLRHVGLLHKADQPARLLSGGEAQRLALARALATDPDVLFLDEPTASLDPGSVLAIEHIVSDALARGVRVVFVTHDIGQARRMADDVVFLNRGRVAEHSPASAFFPTPQTPVARDFLAGHLLT